MYAVGQCTWYVKNRAPWVGTYWGNGAQWGASAAADGYTVNGTPAAGAVVVFAAGQSVGGEWTADGTYGHVAYVESYDPAKATPLRSLKVEWASLHLQDQTQQQ